MIAFFRRWARLLAFVVLLNWQTSSQTKPLHRIYSNVRFIPEAGDLVGFELELDLDGPKASGEFRDYEGGCGIPARVSGTLERGRLTLRGVNKYNVKIEIAGTISGQNAGVTIHVGEGAPETVKLMLAAKAHCRETSQLPL